MNYHILLTVDVEDWFHVENFRRWISLSSWPSYEVRVEKNTHRLLDLLDSIKARPSAMSHESDWGVNCKATFFVLGWVAQRLPHLVREIHSRGHEVASHGYYHRLCREESPEGLKKDLTDSKKILEDIIGAPVFGYRTPSFSIDDGVLEVVKDSGYLYDSSFNSFGMHRRYGRVAVSGNRKKGIALQVSDLFYELPISNMTLWKCNLPWGGGGYFRLIPFHLFRLGVESILKKQKAYLFYIHPWEIDPDQPKVNEAHEFYKFRHYVNLSRTHSKLSKFLESFNQCHFVTSHQYLVEIAQ